MNILDQIVADKKILVHQKKKTTTLSQLEQRSLFTKPVFSFRDFLLDTSLSGIIAEFKRRSPSRGVINATADVEAVATSYFESGASAISVLTDEKYFGGSLADLEKVAHLQLPKLRKDFIVDEYQLVEAKAAGADIILLIAACLSPGEVEQFSKAAKKLGLNVLLEIHHEGELIHICEDVDVVGVNNRDLKTFSVDLNRSLELSGMIPAGKLKISESGIHAASDVHLLRRAGYHGILIGEQFMKTKDPGRAFHDFVKEIKNKDDHEN